jgi:predicted nucleic acid-binding protein
MKVDRLVASDFLLDRWRNGDGSAASAYARAHLGDSLAIPWTVKGEFLRAAALAESDSVELLEFLARYPTLWPDEETVIGFGRLGAALRRQRLSLGATDLWLAASTLQLDVPLVTRDTEGIGRVPGIRIDPF